MRFIYALLSLLLLGVLVVDASVNVIASVRGKRYEIEAETVEEFTAKVESVVNLEAGQQSVLFRGKVLTPSDVLADVGVSPGDVLMVVKGKRARPKETETEQSEDAVSTSGGEGGSLPGFMNQQGPPNPADMDAAMKQMDSLLDSNVFDEYLKDDETLEKARLQLLENLDQYEKSMPGFKAQALEIVSDPVKWKDAMVKAKEQIGKLKEQRDQFRSKQPPTE